ncbi:MAG TPA: LamG domain-containing protein, partial [Verrucomicrobiae bacterium]
TVTVTYSGVSASQTLYVSGSIQSLTHRYSFTSDAADTEGTANGTLKSGAVISGSNVVLNGSSAYVDLPNNLFTNYNSVTFEAWFNDYGGNGWARLWDFGNSTGGEGNQGNGTSYMYFSVPDGYGGIRGAYNAGSGEQVVAYGVRPATGTPHHVVWTQDGTAAVAKIYLDGQLIAENDSFTTKPSNLSTTVNDWLGRSQYNDPYFYGAIDEFRIYNAPLSPQEVAQDYQLGPNVSPQSGAVSVIAQPASVTVTERQAASFAPVYTGHRPVFFQWYRNGTAIPGATNSSYQFVPVPTDTGAVFKVALSNLVSSTVYTVNSSNAVLTVLPDTNPPVVVRAFNVGPTNVQLGFSKPVALASATNPANYSFTNGLAVTAAAALADGSSVLLTTTPLTFGSNYWIQLNNIKDLAATPNVIATNTLISFTALPYAPQDLGNPGYPAQLTVVSNGFNVTAAGTDFGGYGDQGNFSYQQVNGDFDVAVRVAGLTLTDIFAKAGLMVRENLTANCRFAAAMTTPAMNGSFFEWRDATAGNANTSGNFPANYPNTWLRLARVGSTLTAYAAYDGRLWTQLGTA